MNKKTLALKTGGTDTLLATVLPENAQDKSVTLTSSDSSIVTVTPVQGKVTAVKAGTAEVVATTVNGKTDKCVVTVTD